MNTLEYRKISIALPPALAFKAEAFAAEMARRTGKRTPLSEIVILSLAQYVHGEHLLGEHYERRQKKKAAKESRQVQRAAVKKTYMDKMLSDILKSAGE